jgi:hypothetical protein
MGNWVTTSYEAADRTETVDLTKNANEPETEMQTESQDITALIEMGYHPRQVMVLEVYVRTPGEMNTVINFTSEVVRRYRQIFSTVEMKKLFQRNPALKQFKARADEGRCHFVRWRRKADDGGGLPIEPRYTFGPYDFRK